MAVEPTPPPRPADDVIQDLQRSGWSRWTPRRAGVPALTDWWPAYVLVIALAVLAILVTLRLAAELLGPLGHVLVIAGIACVLTLCLSSLVTPLYHLVPRSASATLASVVLLAVVLVRAAVIL